MSAQKRPASAADGSLCRSTCALLHGHSVCAFSVRSLRMGALCAPCANCARIVAMRQDSGRLHSGAAVPVRRSACNSFLVAPLLSNRAAGLHSDASASFVDGAQNKLAKLTPPDKKRELA